MTRLLSSLCICLGHLALLVPSHAQNLLENGSFEISRNLDPKSGTTLADGSQIDSWLVGGANKVMYVGTVMTASDGKRSVMLQFVTANYIQQTIPTVAGQSYRVYFDASAYVGPTGSGARIMRGMATARSSTDTVLASKDFSYDGTNKTFPDVGWAPFSFDFTAADTATTLRWESNETGNNGGPCVDNARVVPGHDDGAGNWVISGPPVFSKRLAPITQAVTGRPLKMEVEALGDGPLTYQWYRVSNNNVSTAISGATEPAYEIASFANNQTGLYEVVVSNNLLSITNRTSVTRISPPGIAGQPEEQHISVGTALSFGPGSFSGSAPDQFQWYKDGQPVEGQTNMNFFKASAELSDAGDYYVHVANIAGEANSAIAKVVVFDGPVPPWIKFNQLPPSMNVQDGGSLFLTVGGAGSSPLTYYFFKDGQVLQSNSQNNLFRNGVTSADSGTYWVVLSNSVGTVQSSNCVVFVYPQQEGPFFPNSSSITNVGEGIDLTLKPALSKGTHLVFQWYKRPLNEFSGWGEPISGATSQELLLNSITFADSAQYTLVATNFVGQHQTTVIVNVIAKPVFSSPLQSYEGPEGGQANFSVSIENWSSNLKYQWYKDGQPIPGATASSYQVNAGPGTLGVYTVEVENEAGKSTSNPATIMLRPITPASSQFQLVADYTVPAPERPGVMLTVVGDAHIRSGVVTFQSTPGNDIGGLYRWESGTVSRVVDLTTALPGFNAAISDLDGLSAEETGLAYFVGHSTNTPGNQVSVFQANNGVYQPIATQNTTIPGKPNVRMERYGYTSHAGGKVAFFGMQTIGEGGYRCVLVWDGTMLQNWANSDNPLPAGDGVWYGNSSQVGFDGTTLAFWAVDQTGGLGGTRNGIFMTINGGPLQKIAFTGDPIPGGLGTFKGFNSPPRVHDGKVLFLGQPASGSGNFLLEYANGVLRVVAKTGDSPVNAGAFTSLGYNFDYLADGSILFSANGPGQKQGIYNYQNGTITEYLTTLNSINGRTLRYLSLYDADGMDTVIGGSYDGSRFGLWTTAGSAPAAPKITVARTASNMTLNWSVNAVLQESTDLQNWSDVQNALPPFQVQFTAPSGKYYRIVQK